MNPYIVVFVALTVGVVLGFCFAAALSMSKEPATVKPEPLTALKATPEEITAVYEARREMEAMRNEELKAWEKEQGKKRKRR
ncbi:hypothetical protein A2V82_16405 [candidate division KSB1 bacterium RBG_16_48_16]|nr:MAG: hypothetical protein A2V82_16405 [candidate division KSB1 bacterium RBG_16_48_16]